MTDEYKEMVCRVRFIDGVPAQTYLSDVEIVRSKDGCGMKRTEIKQILHSELCASYCKKCPYDFYEDACKYCHKNQLLEWIMDVCGVQRRAERKEE